MNHLSPFHRFVPLAALSLLSGCGSDSGTDPVGDGTPSDPLPGSWASAASLPVGVSESGVVVSAGRIVLAGGRTDGRAPTAAVQAYDPGTDRWERLVDLTEAVAHPGLAVHDGALVALGGNASSGGFTARTAVRTLDAASATWVLHSALPTVALAPLAAPHRDGLLALELGSFPSPPQPARGAAMLAPGAREWAVADSLLPPERPEFLLAEAGRTWAVGTTEIWELQGGAWTRVAPLPSSGSLVGAWVSSGTIYVLMVEARRGRMRRWDAAAAAWEPMAPLAEGADRVDAMTATVGGRLYLIGGVGGIRRVDVFTPPA